MSTGGGRRVTLLLFVVGIGLWIIGDLYTTYLAIDAGAIEANPAGRILLANHGFAGATVLKVGVTVLIVVHWLLCTRGAAWLRGSPGFDQQPVWVRGIARYATFAHPIGLCLLGGALTAWNALIYVALK